MPYKPEDVVLEDHEILPMSGKCFGVFLTKEEAKKFLDEGYQVKSIELTAQEETRYYLVVWIDVNRQGEGFNVAMLETMGRGTIVISPFEWEVGNRSGAKAYLKKVIECDLPVSTEDGGTLKGAEVGDLRWHGYDTADIYDAQDDCLIAIQAGEPLRSDILQRIPPERASMLAGIAEKAGTGLAQGTFEQLRAEADKAGMNGKLGDWWK